MAHGAPDDSNVVKFGPLHRVDDMAELAARLRSPVLWDRRGDVLLAADFREGLEGFQPIAVGAGAAVALSTEYARHGGYCVQLTGGNIADRPAQLAKRLPPLVLSNAGLEFSFSVHTETEYMQWELPASYANVSYGYGIRYDHQNSILERRTGLVAWTQFAAGVVLQETREVCHTGKMVVDLSMGQYVRFILDSGTYSMAGLAAYSVAAPGTDYVRALISHYSTGGNNEVAYVDSVIVTQNEPV